MAPPIAGELIGKLLDRQVALEARDGGELFERADHVTPARRRTSSGRRRRWPSRAGTRTREVLSPTPPVEYLSIFGFAMCEVDHLAGKHHLLGQNSGLLGRHLLEIDRHQKRGELRLGHFAIQSAVDDESNLFLSKLLTITLFLDQRSEGGLDESALWDVTFRHVLLKKCERGPLRPETANPSTFRAKVESITGLARRVSTFVD